MVLELCSDSWCPCKRFKRRLSMLPEWPLAMPPHFWSSLLRFLACFDLQKATVFVWRVTCSWLSCRHFNRLIAAHVLVRRFSMASGAVAVLVSLTARFRAWSSPTSQRLIGSLELLWWWAWQILCRFGASDQEMWSLQLYFARISILYRLAPS